MATQKITYRLRAVHQREILFHDEEFQEVDGTRMLRMMETIAEELCHPSLFELTVTRSVTEG
jgi:hypothetical protein